MQQQYHNQAIIMQQLYYNQAIIMQFITYLQRADFKKSCYSL